VQNAEETSLAWTLADLARPRLSVSERSRVFLAVGAGDTFSAIRMLLKLLSAKQIPLRADLARRLTTWLGAYANHQEEQNLRRLIECYLVPDASAALPTIPGAPARKHHDTDVLNQHRTPRDGCLLNDRWLQLSEVLMAQHYPSHPHRKPNERRSTACFCWPPSAAANRIVNGCLATLRTEGSKFSEMRCSLSHHDSDILSRFVRANHQKPQ
jgi:hypothetical protein